MKGGAPFINDIIFQINDVTLRVNDIDLWSNDIFAKAKNLESSHHAKRGPPPPLGKEGALESAFIFFHHFK